MKKIEITNYDELKTDVSELLKRVPRLSAQDRMWFAKAFTREVLRKAYYVVDTESVATETQPVLYRPGRSLHGEAVYILDWLAGLEERDPRLHAKLSKITFKQASQHSQKWHEALAKAAEKSDRYVEPDEANAPKVLDLGDGWEVFWLKTDLARDIEGEVMGHCVGDGGYDDLYEGQAVFSIRKNNIAHITLGLDNQAVEQAVTKGNGEVPERYQWLVKEATATLGLKLLLGKPLADTAPIADGAHETHDGTIIHTKDGRIHREDGPAIIAPENEQLSWYLDGELHREDGPAVVRPGIMEEWYIKGERHREDGPAIIATNGREEWHRDGELHREDGPAIITRDGTQQWWLHGKVHRLDGPAIIRPDGTKMWCRDGVCHREDGPAIIHADGTLEWFLDGKRHRDDGPAVMSSKGARSWYQKGAKHRDDGPAEIKGEVQTWYRHGVRHQDDGPAEIEVGVGRSWYRNGELHRVDGPAFIDIDGTQHWYLHGQRHREDGPALITARGEKYWFLDNVEYSESQFKKELRARRRRNENANEEVKEATHAAVHY